MIVYRIAKTRHIYDLTGAGARLYGGRWNHKGIGMIYTSENRSLASLEFLVHVHHAILPTDLSIAAIKIPDSIISKEISIPDLPDNWNKYPPPLKLADIGTRWALSNVTLLLRVPSVVVQHEFNILINPSHPDINNISISKVEQLKFDDRLLR